jgi:hypothetical protein
MQREILLWKSCANSGFGSRDDPKNILSDGRGTHRIFRMAESRHVIPTWRLLLFGELQKL